MERFLHARKMYPFSPQFSNTPQVFATFQLHSSSMVAATASFTVLGFFCFTRSSKHQTSSNKKELDGKVDCFGCGYSRQKKRESCPALGSNGVTVHHVKLAKGTETEDVALKALLSRKPQRLYKGTKQWSI